MQENGNCQDDGSTHTKGRGDLQEIESVICTETLFPALYFLPCKLEHMSWGKRVTVKVPLIVSEGEI